MPQESQVPNSDFNHDSEVAARSGLAEVYSFQTGLRIDTQPIIETESHLVETVRNVADELAELRNRHLHKNFFKHNETAFASVVKRLFGIEVPTKRLDELTTEDLIEAESNIGGELFPTTRPVIAKFWNANRNNYYYHECKLDNSESVTLHYLLLEEQSAVLKISSDPKVPDTILSGRCPESVNLGNAVKMYRKVVENRVYNKSSNG